MTGDGRSVGIVRLLTEGSGVCLFFSLHVINCAQNLQDAIEVSEHQ
jgi:hypothetical protein